MYLMNRATEIGENFTDDDFVRTLSIANLARTRPPF